MKSTKSRWRVTINGDVFEGSYRVASDAVTAAMRKYLAGGRRWQPTTEHLFFQGATNAVSRRVVATAPTIPAHTDGTGYDGTGYLEEKDTLKRRRGESTKPPPERDFDEFLIHVERVPVPTTSEGLDEFRRKR